MRRHSRTLLASLAVLALALALTACGNADPAAPLDAAPITGDQDLDGDEVVDDTPEPTDQTDDGAADGPDAADGPEPADQAGGTAPAPSDGDCSAQGHALLPVDSTDLPAAVTATRDFLLDAALRCDEQLLFTAIEESSQFTYSFGGGDDAIGFWWELEEAGEAPFLRLAQVLSTTPSVADGGEVVVWPRVHTGRPEDTTDEAWREVVWSPDAEAAAANAGSYLDWRVGISTDGEWRFFVRGD
jgi:predicted small lipoprotein YifL